MAGEVSHVVYAARMLTHLQGKVQGPSYWAGTLFPDIRHLGIITRRHTHIADVTLSSLAGNNDFLTGMRVHAWIDSTREKFLRDQNIKENLPWHPFVPHALKLVEDELLYEHFDDWNLIHRTLSNVFDEELHYVHDREKITTWHSILQRYFKEKPTDQSRKQLDMDIGLSESSADEVNSVVKSLQEDKRTLKLVHSFLKYLEQTLQ
ncbi:MAG: hypothetical protein WD200_01900 [Candidatus Andersenbacteria bacterium]